MQVENGGGERVNDRVETAGARNHHEATSRFMVQMTLPIRTLHPQLHPSALTVCSLTSCPLPPGASPLQYPLSQGKSVVDHVEPPTIFYDRNLILSDVNQRGREPTPRPSYTGYVSSSLCFPRVHSSIFRIQTSQVTIIFPITRTIGQ